MEFRTADVASDIQNVAYEKLQEQAARHLALLPFTIPYTLHSVLKLYSYKL